MRPLAPLLVALSLAAPAFAAPHVLYGKSHYNSDATFNQDQLVYHGGAVETTPSVYLVYWGTEWQNGFSINAGGYTYTNATAQNYVNAFFANLGGSPWNGVQTQYCQGVAVGSVNCNGNPAAQFIQNPKHLLKGVWLDPTPVPALIATTDLVQNTVDDPVAQEALKAVQHFGYDVNATYFILTPPGHAATLYGTVYCAYHDETSNVMFGPHGARYAFIPYVPEQGASCGGNSVNAQNDAFGHGYFDSYSIVSGHEFAEAETDPDNFSGVQDGWNDVQTSENGDKCAYKSLQNIVLGNQFFAVQPMWSNASNGGAGACAVSLP